MSSDSESVDDVEVMPSTSESITTKFFLWKEKEETNTAFNWTAWAHPFSHCYDQ